MIYSVCYMVMSRKLLVVGATWWLLDRFVQMFVGEGACWWGPSITCSQLDMALVYSSWTKRKSCSINAPYLSPKRHKTCSRQTAFVFPPYPKKKNLLKSSTLERRIPSSKKVYATCPFSHSISSCEMKNESYISSESTWQIARFKISQKGTRGKV